jgi:hypothetical protein
MSLQLPTPCPGPGSAVRRAPDHAGGDHAQCNATFKGGCRFAARTAAGNTQKSDGPLVFRQGAGNQMNCLELQQY